jgi:hypothetical protein
MIALDYQIEFSKKYSGQYFSLNSIKCILAEIEALSSILNHVANSKLFSFDL